MMSCCSSRVSKPPKSMLEKKIPENPRFKNVKSKVDTGASLRRYMATMAELRQNSRYRKDEIFQRIKLTTFVQLILQVEQLKAMEADAAGESETKENGAGEIGKADGDVGNLNRTQTTKNGQTHLTDLPEEAISSPFSLNGTLDGIGEAASPRPPAINMRPYAGLNSVIHGFGQLDLDSSGRVVETKEALREEARLQLNYRPDVTSPYLLLDVRSADTYEQSHIITAKSFPSSLLSRDRESKDNLAYKNKEGRIVIVYDEDESVACQAAHTLVQRGYSNLFLLSGGLRLASQHFPVGLTTGTVPETCLRERVRRRRPLVKASQAEFTRRDVEALQETLDRIHAPQHDTARTGRMSTMTTRSSARSIHTGSSSRSRNGAAPRRK